MKRKTITIIAMMLVGSMMTTSLTGCGTKAEATNKEVSDMQEETIIAGGDEESTVDEGDDAVNVPTDEMSVPTQENDITESASNEDITDGNIVLYGGEKRESQYQLSSIESCEEVSIEMTDVLADIPLYSGEGRLCGYLKEGGSIVVTEHCSPMTAWYRFVNPIEGTEYDYLYILNDEITTSTPEFAKERILFYLESVERATLVDSPDSDMECYEFSVPKVEFVNDISDYMYNDEFDITKYRYFYIECTRDGDFINSKIYYKKK